MQTLPIPRYVDERWTTEGSRVYIRDIQLDSIHILLPDRVLTDGFKLHNGNGGRAFCTINCDINLNIGKAGINAYVVLDWSTGTNQYYAGLKDICCSGAQTLQTAVTYGTETGKEHSDSMTIVYLRVQR